jgi:ElaB/YqjD/DUF883 family membrane-anchored ribosome-binding protein
MSTIDQGKSELNEMAEEAEEQTRSLWQKIRSGSEDMRDELRGKMKEVKFKAAVGTHPIQTIAYSLVVGLLLGLFLSRKD